MTTVQIAPNIACTTPVSATGWSRPNPSDSLATDSPRRDGRTVHYHHVEWINRAYRG
jgi:hypothetical protein